MIGRYGRQAIGDIKFGGRIIYKIERSYLLDKMGKNSKNGTEKGHETRQIAEQEGKIKS